MGPQNNSLRWADTGHPGGGACYIPGIAGWGWNAGTEYNVTWPQAVISGSERSVWDDPLPSRNAGGGGYGAITALHRAPSGTEGVDEVY